MLLRGASVPLTPRMQRERNACILSGQENISSAAVAAQRHHMELSSGLCTLSISPHAVRPVTPESIRYLVQITPIRLFNKLGVRSSHLTVLPG